jgi:hypothetical protein
MIDKYEDHVFYISCDICGATEEGPFESWDDAVQYKKDHPDQWRSLRIYDKEDHKSYWNDVCAGCIPKTPLGTWKHIPASKGHPQKSLNKTVADIGKSIGKSIEKRSKK